MRIALRRIYVSVSALLPMCPSAPARHGKGIPRRAGRSRPMKQIRIVRPRPVRPRQTTIDTRTPSGRVLPY